MPQPDGTLVVEALINPPGGFVTLRAKRNLLLVVTACPVDHHPTNGGVCTEIEVETNPQPVKAVIRHTVRPQIH